MTDVIVQGENYACFACNTSMQAFGPLFHNVDRAREFREWLGGDPRGYNEEQLNDLKSEWRNERGGQ